MYISDYMLMVKNTEPPIPFHLWSCMASLSALAGRRFWFELGPLTFYPHMYIVLVADPGVQKTSAMNRGKDIVQAVANCPIAAAQATKEFMTKAMSDEKFPGRKYFQNNGVMEEYNQYSIFATELTQFIGVNPLGMLDFLTTIYDQKIYNCDTKNCGSDFILGPYVTMIACMTPQIVKGYLKMNILTGGFARRTIWVFQTGGKIVPFPDFTQEQKEAMARCILWGKALQGKSGQFHFTPDARDWYESWYVNLRTNIKEIATPSTEGYYRSKHEQLFKVSMLIALANPETFTRDKLYITADHFLFAEKHLFAPVEANLERVFEGSGINPNANAVGQVVRMLEALGRPMNKKHLEAMFYDQVTSLNELRDMITHLCAVGKLAQRTITVNNIFCGELIGTPECMKGRSDVELAPYLQQVVGPPPELGKGPDPSVDPLDPQ